LLVDGVVSATPTLGPSCRIRKSNASSRPGPSMESARTGERWRSAFIGCTCASRRAIGSTRSCPLII